MNLIMKYFDRRLLCMKAGKKKSARECKLLIQIVVSAVLLYFFSVVNKFEYYAY